ncbi:MAG: polyhydroxyalkanoic acid system family protein [Myxococcaceae bacterium]
MNTAPTWHRPLLQLLTLALALAVAPSAWAETPEPPPAASEEVPDLGPGARLKFLVAHHFARADAKTRVRQLLEYWSTRFGVKHRWVGDQVQIAGRVFGVEFRARLEVGDTAVGGEATDPGMFLRSSADDYVKKKLRKYLSPTYEET